MSVVDDKKKSRCEMNNTYLFPIGAYDNGIAARNESPQSKTTFRASGEFLESLAVQRDVDDAVELDERTVDGETPDPGHGNE